jgi:bifunctional non-homologous end joining protein LigD
VEQQPLCEGERRVAGEEACEEESQTRAREEQIEKETRMKMPSFIEPQLARLMKAPPGGDGWVHEVKFDGYRMQMHVEKGHAKLFTRKALDWTERFPEITKDGGALPDCIIDGEICALNADGASDFGLLQTALSDHKTGNLIYYIFDCLFVDGRDLRKASLSERKKILEKLLKRASKRLHFVAHFTSSGDAMLAAACRMDLEGVISKRLDAPYQSGRGDSWTKSKCRGGQEVVIGAWRGMPGKFRSLMVGTFKNGKLRYMGRVGTGYNAKVAADLLKRLKPLKRTTSPFDDKPPRLPDVNWVEPKLVAEIEFENVTSDGLFRQAAFKGLRLDKPADAVVKETPADAPKEKVMAAKTRMSAKSDNVVLGVIISHPDKVLWPKSELGPTVTKLDLAKYMALVADRMLPHVKDRPISIVRTPDGINGEMFFQRHALKGTAVPMLAIKVAREEEPFLGVDSAGALVALAQQAVTELHPWGSKPGDPETPERIILDLDPAPDVKFSTVVEGAKELKARLEMLGFTPFVKTTGGKGLHVVIAIKGTTWPKAKAFAKAVAIQLEKDAPDRYTATIAKKARAGKIFVDYLRNDQTSTGVAPWSPRAREGATIAVPLEWREVTAKLDPKKFTVHTAPNLLKKKDAWKDLAKSAKPIAAAMKKLGG